MILMVESRESRACGTTRYRLSNGWFIDGAKRRAHYSYNFRYGVWAPAMPHANFMGGSNTLKGALEVATARQEAADANLARMAFGSEYR
ncbi:MAG: hypothetical protein ACJ72N_07475 [Labedaea sp.]|jgi:hypothetical protein